MTFRHIPGPLSEVPGVARSAMMATTMGRPGCLKQDPGLRIARSNLKGPPLLEADGSQWGWVALLLRLLPLLAPHIHILPNPLFSTHPDQLRSGDYFKVLPLKFCHLQVGIKMNLARHHAKLPQVLSI